MACRHVLFWSDFQNTLSTSTTYRSVFRHYNGIFSNEPNTAIEITIPCTVRDLAIALTAAPGGATSRTFTVRKNGADTALTITISGASTSGSNTSDAITFAVGDTISLKCTVSGSPANTGMSGFSLTIDGTTTGESMYGSCAGTNTIPLSVGTSIKADLFHGQNNFWTTAGSYSGQVASAPGAVTKIVYRLMNGSGVATSPGTSNGIRFTVYKNRVAQDGSGGTTDTRCTVTGSATSGTWTGSLAVANGDQFYVLAESLDASNAAVAVSISAKFVATTDGESQGCCGGMMNSSVPNGGTLYYGEYCEIDNSGWQTTESGEQHAYVGPNTLTLRTMTVGLTNGSAVASISGAGSQTVATGDLLTIKASRLSGTVTFVLRLNTADSSDSASGSDSSGSTSSWCFTQYASAPATGPGERAWTFVDAQIGGTFAA